MKEKRNYKSKFDRIISVFAWLSLIFAFFACSICVLASFSSEQNGKEIFGIKMLIVASDSMSKSPLSENEKIFFNSGDIVIIKKVEDNRSLNVGDVISFVSYNSDSYGKTLTHKIKSIKYNASNVVIGYETYGINTGVSDKAIVTPNSIIGIYVNKIPNVGRIFAFMKTPSGYYLSILTPSILIMIYFSLKAGMAIEKRKKTLNYDQEIKLLKERILVLEGKDNVSNGSNDNTNGESIEALALTISENAFTEDNISTNTLNFVDKNIPRGKKIPFSQKLLSLDGEIQDYFNQIHNELISYKKVHDRLSIRGISYRYGKKLLAKMTVRGKTLKLHLDLDVNELNYNAYYQKDLSNVKAYKQVPFTVKVKSNRGKNNAIKLVNELMAKNEIVKNSKFNEIDAVEQLKEKINL